jgi:hypothetical protein
VERRRLTELSFFAGVHSAVGYELERPELETLARAEADFETTTSGSVPERPSSR